MLSLTAILSPDSTAAELHWRSSRIAAKKPANKAIAQRFVPPRPSKLRVDKAVRPAALEEEGPQLTSESDGDGRLRSIVVDRQELPQSPRSAQLPSSQAAGANELRGTSTAETPAQTEIDSRLEEQLRDPFGDEPRPIPEPDLPLPDQADVDTRTEPEADRTLPPSSPRQPTGQQPFEPAPNQFQPNLPPGGQTAQSLPDAIPAPSPAALETEAKQTEAACADSLAKLRAKTIGTVNLSIAVSGTEGQDFPFECELGDGQWHAGRAWPQTTYLWKASALCHKPLYFEDEQLERYGHSWPPCCQPFVSGAHFFTRLPVLPYCLGVEPPHECIYALGHYRPGSCAPYMCNPIPLSARGALFQAGATVGAAALLP